MSSRFTPDQMASSSKPTFFLCCPFDKPLQPRAHVERAKLDGRREKSPFFFLIQSGRWRRGHCWLTPQPLIQRSQKKWQSQQRKWELCSWTRRWQEVEKLWLTLIKQQTQVNFSTFLHLPWSDWSTWFPLNYIIQSPLKTLPENVNLKQKGSWIISYFKLV